MIKQILLIDDDPIVNFIHTKVVQHNFPGISVKLFTNGLQALEHIRNHPTYCYLIFLDLNMPIMDGWAFLDAISSEEKETNLQIHIVTSSLDPSDKMRAKSNVNVVSYMVKPLKSSDLDPLIFTE
ncbi:response regulator [Algoriphagus sp. Y33]|uniref:response regulator n=1 Tax=Algoriphagus sp. Y33 TaxID=2772483 RepID=UPI001783ED3B|nr:response regulator [Algoriphagus sp. Y33]